ncbi:hypothetical protein CHU92_09240 [Flavobacterium cyanobacteriorum]|uniref:Plasmid stabilization protein n=1 Tax=Flavobacterium cyanobacteriorum TaxID=2022802 RepID=A0A255Z814_9FLAO|nr:type II toxin-antitoxin system RelE/ParE family toxin [Flavobacterium cyanobacteriorum]OYQ36770.1 hypothetical protein CHU92_09240 [Flavobacterium cyanobacteriorum]
MKNGFKLLWTENALNELAETINYPELNWTERDIENFVSRLENTLHLIVSNPELFPSSGFKNIKRAVVTKHNVLYYRVNKKSIEIISLFSTQQNPLKRNIK